MINSSYDYIVGGCRHYKIQTLSTSLAHTKHINTNNNNNKNRH
jgi:hypothetical protein